MNSISVSSCTSFYTLLLICNVTIALSTACSGEATHDMDMSDDEIGDDISEREVDMSMDISDMPVDFSGMDIDIMDMQEEDADIQVADMSVCEENTYLSGDACMECPALDGWTFGFFESVVGISNSILSFPVDDGYDTSVLALMITKNSAGGMVAESARVETSVVDGTARFDLSQYSSVSLVRILSIELLTTCETSTKVSVNIPWEPPENELGDALCL